MSLLLNLLFEPDSYSNAYLLPKIGFDTAENERCKVWPVSKYPVGYGCGRLPRRAGAGRGGPEAGESLDHLGVLRWG